MLATRKARLYNGIIFNGKDLPIAHVNTYSPGRRQAKYYRLSYRVGNRTKHVHIPGGSVLAKLAQLRARTLLKMIARGAPLEELLAVIAKERK